MSGKGKMCNDRSDLGTGSSLLNFMNFASCNLKSALEKPANFKRNINHRRYLQKQLRNYSKRKNEVNPVRKSGSSHTTRTKASPKAHEKRTLVKNITKTWRTEMKPGEFIADVQVEKTPALRERNFPLSFWQEPIIPDPPNECGNFYSLEEFQTRNSMDNGGYGTGYGSFLESWENCGRQDLSPQSSHCESVPSTLSDESILDEFLTGEELTRSIDIKDLYVPELCFTDRSAEGSQEELYIDTLMSPSQYILSPSEHGFFNFQFDQEAQSQLPPIALAFLSPCSLSGQSYEQSA